MRLKLAALLMLLLMIAALGGAASARTASFTWTAAQLPVDGAGGVNLLDPVKHYLSSRAWLVAEGMDPGATDRPGWDLMTRLDWSALGADHPANASGQASPLLQAVSGAALVPFRNPAPAFSRDILIPRDFGRIPIQTEPHLAVNPYDPDHLVVGMIDYNFPTLASYVSLDGGSTWDGPFQVPYHQEDMVGGGDPVLAFDRHESVYMTGISIGSQEFALGPIYLTDRVSSITVSRSDDGGYTWPLTIATARSNIRLEDQWVDPTGRLRGSIVIGFLDKPWIAVGPHPDDPRRDVVYVTYTDFETYYNISWMGELPFLSPSRMATTIRMVRSEDGGISWSEPIAVSETVIRSYGEVQSGDAPGQVAADRVVQGAQPVVGPNGELYVTWLDSTDDGSMRGLAEIWISRSNDAGKTFGKPVIATTFNEVAFRPRTAYFRYWGSAFPQIAVAPDGKLYIAYGARTPIKPNDDGDIYVVSSSDGGFNWSRPRRVNDDDGNALQFFPSIDVGPDGKVHVMWLDMRDDPAQIRYHVYYSRSEDGGNTWGFELPEFGFRVRDTRVTDFPSNPNRGFPSGVFIGDYVSLKATEDEVYMVWPDTRLGEFGPTNQKIGFARQRAVRSPDVYVQPSAGAGGDKITVQGFDFQPDMNVFIQLQDATIATARTNHEGRFTASLYVPVTGEGAQDLRVFDESGNMASTSFYTEFGFGNIQDLYQDLTGRMEDLMRALERVGSGQ